MKKNHYVGRALLTLVAAFFAFAFLDNGRRNCITRYGGAAGGQLPVVYGKNLIKRHGLAAI